MGITDIAQRDYVRKSYGSLVFFSVQNERGNSSHGVTRV